MPHGYRWPGAAVLAMLITLALGGSAYASPTTDINPVPVASGSAGVGGYDIDGFEPTTLTVFNLHVEGSATWSGSLTTDVGWDSDKVRQGQDVTVTRSAPIRAGKINVSWVLTGTLSPLGIGSIDIGTHTLSKDDVTCVPQLSGAGYSCTAESDGLTLVKTPGIPLSPYVKIALGVKFDVTPEGAVVGRSFTVGTNPLVPDTDLSLLDSQESEQFSMPCDTPAGNSAIYKLDPFDWSPDVAATQRPRIVIGLMDPVLGVVELPALFDGPFGPAKNTTPAFDLTGGPDTVNLGALQANNIPPKISPFGGSFSGTEGSPISFSATTMSQCPIDSYVWEFSNGTKSFGPTPQRSFKDNGVYDGQLTVTDETGLSATRSFTVDVSNVVPSVDGGPDTTADWGRSVAFNGQATDPGADDQPTLHYAWDFGDGSPSATGGPSVLHAYSLPGAYTATLTVCDKDENPVTDPCPTDSRVVNVTKRDTSTGYTGDAAGTFDTASTLSASLVDEYGQAVNGRTITFTVGSDPVLTASTNSSGVATKSYTPQLVANSYPALADFAGDSLYNGSSSTHSFDVSKKASTMTYTGAVTGGPNKTIVLSAVLKDATGKPLSGRTVQFQLGSQSANAVTDGTGAASTSLKLTQKNGTYTVSAAWVPGSFAPAGDATRYLGSSDAKVFKLQAK